jgi:HEAT repeat protein
MSKRSFEDQLSRLDALASRSPDEAAEPLRAALKHANNYLVAKAAEVVRRLELHALQPDLAAAFDRFMVDAETRDPQCWAKNALSRTLMEFECQESSIFLRGLRHVQMEPVWGGRSDTAGTLRATCAQALVGCRELHERELLAILIELFQDKDKTVRVEAARAIAQVGSDAAMLLLRLRATLRNDEPELLAACFSGVLELQGTAAVAWVEGFLPAGDDTGAEAALALGQTRSAEAWEALRRALDSHRDSWFCGVLLTAIALTRRPEAFAYLLELIEEESRLAADAIPAVMQSAPPAEIRERLEPAVRSTGNERLLQVLKKAQADS